MSAWARQGGGSGEKRGPGILNKIPGYSGYRAKEGRRDEDKRVRLELARQYGQIAQRLSDVQGELVRAQRFAEIGNVERLEKSLRLFTDRLSTATYGYGGLFSDRSIDEKALDQIAAFDRALGDGLDELKAGVESLSSAILGGGDVGKEVRATQTLIDNLNRRFELRGQAIESGQPVGDTSVGDLLAGVGEGEQAHVASDLHFGDAVSISGTDYLVRGRMEFHDGPLAWRQYLLKDGNTDRWLHVPPSTAEPMALLAPFTETPGESAMATIGGVAYSQQGAGTANAEVIGESGQAAGRQAQYRRYFAVDGGLMYAYDWGGEKQTLAGRTIDPLEIQVYSRP